MFRRRTSSPGKIHYRVNINKNSLGVVDIYIDRKPYQSGFKKIEVIRIGGQIVSKDQQYEYNVLLGTTGGVSKGTLTYLYNSGMHRDLADTELYGNRITEFTPITEITDPEEIINFTYMSEFYNQITSNNRITWQGHLITSDHRITANACEGCQSVAVGTGVYNNTYNVNMVIVVPS